MRRRPTTCQRRDMEGKAWPMSKRKRAGRWRWGSRCMLDSLPAASNSKISWPKFRRGAKPRWASSRPEDRDRVKGRTETPAMTSLP
eukprot:7711640-Pyramimonas_sp.AAC.1